MRPDPTLVLVEDSPKLADSLRRGLGEEGFHVVAYSAGKPALEHVLRQNADVVILDLGLPDLDGIEVLAQIRTAGADVPVLVLSARDAIGSRVDALDRGADDFLVKPFAFEELLARVHALLRRASAERRRPISFGNVTLDPWRAECSVAGKAVTLSPRERTLLALLLRRRGLVLRRLEILREAFGYHFDPGTNIVDVHVVHLRRKLAEADVALESVRGAGYRLVARR